MKTWPIVAVEVDSPEDNGFTIQFDRPYNILEERLPVDDNAVARAIDDAYCWGWPPEEMEERQQVGLLYTDDGGNYIKTECTM